MEVQDEGRVGAYCGQPDESALLGPLAVFSLYFDQEELLDS
jgi:hypothetical protein